MCMYVCNEVRKNLGIQERYQIGDILICRQYKKLKDKKIHVNYRYEIKSMCATHATVENYKENAQGQREVLHLDYATLTNNFRYSYCATCHSSQGASVNTTITIFEWDKARHVSREWLWTAITRASRLENVKFFKSHE